MRKGRFAAGAASAGILFAAALFVAIVFGAPSAAETVSAAGKAVAGNECAAVVEVSSGRAVYELRAAERRPMASTTKILTAITVIEDVADLDRKFRIPANCVGIEGSSVYLEEGECLTARELLYGLMLRSGNDCAAALAVLHSGSVERFAERMNEKAREYGAENSHFVNPHGLHDPDHYTTARDLAAIAVHAMKNPVFREIVSAKSVKIPWADRGYPRVLINKNRMLTEFEGATGIKTGYTKAAGRCLVSSAKRGNAEYVCVVLNCPPMFERSKELLSAAFETYDCTPIVRAGEKLGEIAVRGTDCKLAVGSKEDRFYPLTKEERAALEVRLTIDRETDAPVTTDRILGEIRVFSGKQLLFSQKLFTILGSMEE